MLSPIKSYSAPHYITVANGSWNAMPSERILRQFLIWCAGFQQDIGLMIMDLIPKGELSQGACNTIINLGRGWFVKISSGNMTSFWTPITHWKRVVTCACKH